MSSHSSSGHQPLRNSGSKSPSMSTIESSVTRLLVSTKHLLESLTQWARQEADDKFVSDAYVKLGNDFRAAARAFNNAGVDISDLGDVPKALRIVLESALSEVPTQESLDKFLPNVRNIIVNLLLTLKAKQAKAKELSEHGSRHSSILSRSLNEASPKLDVNLNIKGHHALRDSDSQRYSAKEVLLDNQPTNEERTSSVASSAALAQLQKGNAVLRRASKRFSAYQFAKLANYSTNQLPRLSSESALSDPPKLTIPGEKVNTEEVQTDAPSSIKVFLRIGDRTKKVDLPLPVTVASIRLLFVEKFAYSPGTAAFPDIYILDNEHNITYELEESALDQEVKEGVLLVLKSIDKEKESLKGLQEKVDSFGSHLDNVILNFVNDIKESVDSIKFQMNNAPAKETNGSETADFKSKYLTLSNDLREVFNEIKAIKSVQHHRKSFVAKSIEDLTAELSVLKDLTFAESGSNSNRTYMQHSYAKLSDESDNLLTKVDDLQDMMEALRKDVAQRGVRIGPQQLKSTRKEIDDAKSSLKVLADFISDGKPTWKKIWESELDKVCEEQQFFNLQDDLTIDLIEDIKKIEETFELIEKCSVEQNKNPLLKRNKFTSKLCLIEPGESMHNIKDAVLNEVATLVPNHESRLEAIAKAEKLRQKERELASLTEFQEELGEFVEEKRLKHSVGIEEIEKLRQQKDSENLKSSFGII